MNSNDSIPPLASYETLLSEWKKDQTKTALVAACFFLVMLVMNASLIYWFQGKPHSPGMWVLIVALSLAVSLPFYMVHRTRKPTRADVELSQKLRRAAGMRDDIAKGNENEVWLNHIRASGDENTRQSFWLHQANRVEFTPEQLAEMLPDLANTSASAATTNTSSTTEITP